MSYRPAGLSSDEDSEDDYDFGTPIVKKNYSQNNVFRETYFSSPEEELFDSIKNEDLAKVKKLLENGVDVHALQGGWTPLMYACLQGNPEILKVLLAKGSNINFNKDFYTPLMACCGNGVLGSKSGRMECVELLLAHGVNINAVDRFRVSSLMLASREGLHDIVKLLLEKNCEINKQDKDGWSALFYAVSTNNLQIIDLLIANGANVKLKDLQGQTSYDLAISKSFETAAAKVKFEKPSTELPEPLFDVPAVITIDQMLNELPSRNTGNNPGFPSDVYYMLQGMKLQMYAKQLYEDNIQLGEFLVMNENELKTRGVRFMAHRQKILESVRRFHLFRWNKNSITVKPRNETIELLDGIKLMANIVRHLYVLQTSLHYIEINKCETKATEELKRIISAALKVSNTMDEELTTVQDFSKYINKVKKVQTVDLIVREDKINKPIKLLKISIFCTISAIIFWKNKRYCESLLKYYIAF